MKTVLVTGATGFVGANLVGELVRRGFAVRTFSRTPPSPAGRGGVTQIHTGDIRDTTALRNAIGGCDTVFHTAAIVSFRREDRQEMIDVNAGGTMAVSGACLAAGVRRLVHTSSVAALGHRDDGGLIDESTAFNWGNVPGYRYSKHLAEAEVLSAVGRGLDAVMVNPSVIVGPGDRHVHGGQLVRDAWHGRLRVYAAGGMNLVGVADVVRGEIAAAEKGRRGERYILAGANLTHREALTFVARVLGKPGPRLKVPVRAVKVAARLLETAAAITGTGAIITPDLVAGLGCYNWYSTQKARRELGFTPTSLERAVREAFLWYREHGMLRPDGGDNH